MSNFIDVGVGFISRRARTLFAVPVLLFGRPAPARAVPHALPLGTHTRVHGRV
jgi:hypothetical protein